MNDLAGFTSLAEKTYENAPERLLTYSTLTPTTQNHVPLFIDEARLRE